MRGNDLIFLEMKMMEQPVQKGCENNTEDHIKNHRAEERVEGREKLPGRRA